MSEFFNRTGKIAIGSRLRMLSERITNESQTIYDLYEVGLKPKWFPVFYVISQTSPMSITQVAREINHSHPSVINIVREMKKAGIISDQKDSKDGRKTMIKLTQKGLELADRILLQYNDVDLALDAALHQTQHNIWFALEELEYLLDQKSLYARVLEQKKIRESQLVEIIPYADKYKNDFQKLNEQWIKTYFEMEEADHISLNDPKKYVIDKGGEILIALYDQQPVGVCALIPIDHLPYDYELAKMAVDPLCQGKGIGSILGEAIVDRARTLKAKTLYLESNTVLKPAISLWHKLGFKKVSGHPTPYKRSNIQMVLNLK